MSTSESEQYDLLDQLAEEFAARFRRGERPSLKEYTDRYPELADEIRDLFPAMVRVEQAEDLRQAEEAEVTGDSPPAKLSLNRILREIGPGGASLVNQAGQTSLGHKIGDYQILREIGRGGMGVVYEAEQISLGRRVALKVLPRNVSSDRLVQERFRREARAAARLHHTNIVPVFEVGQDGDVRFYAMQFIQGQGLDTVITELRWLRDRSGSGSKGKARSEGQSPGSGREHMGPDIEAPTVSDGVEVSAVVQSILSGRFDPGGRGPEPARTLAGAHSGGLAAPTGTGRESHAAEPDSAPTSTETGIATPGDTVSPERAHPTAPSLSPSASPSSSSAILPGGTQLSSVESGRRAFFRSLAQIGRQVAGGLAYAHARGIVHRDIKPSNLLLDTEGVVWIADFGLAKGEDEGLTQSGDILGTLRYMSPERFRGEGDARADVYALGLTLYELLTLRPGFESSDRLKLIEQIKTEEPQKLRTIDARIPRDLETIVLKAIDKDPKARYQSAEAMGEDLGRFLADEPIRARQVTATERYWRWARRNPVIAVLGAVLTAVLVATTVGSMVAAAYFKESARRESSLAAREQLANQQSQLDRNEAIEARQLAIKERDHARQQSANLALDRGFALTQEGHADQGLLWMLEALKTAPDDAEGFRRTVRWNLGAWIGQVHKPLRIIDTGGADNLAFSPGGTTFATSDTPNDRSAATPFTLRDTASGRKLSSIPDAFGPFAFRPDGKVIVASTKDGRRVAAFDLATGRLLWKTPDLPEKVGRTLLFSADGSTIFVECDDGDYHLTITQLDADTGRQRGQPIRSWARMAVAPDGRSVATGRLDNGELHIEVLDLSSGRRKTSWRADRKKLAQLVFNPDGKSLFVEASDSFFDDKSSVSQLWDPDRGKPTSRPMPSTSHAIFSPSGDCLVVGRNFQRVVLDAATARERGSRFLYGGECFHPDGRTLVNWAFDRKTIWWQVSADAEPLPDRGSHEEPSMPRSPANGKSRGYHPFRGGRLGADGHIAVLLAEGAGGRELIRLVDPAKGRTLGRPALHYPGWIVRAVAFSPDGRSFATGSNAPDRVASEVRLWDATTGRLLLPPMPHTNWAAALAFHPDSKVLASGDYNGLVRFWDTATGKEIGRPLSQGEIILSLAYSPDGKVLAVGLSSDRTRKPGVRLWDTATRRPIGELLPNTQPVLRIEFRPDGGAILAGGWNSARLWDTNLRQMIAEPMIDEAGAGFRPDGQAFLTLGRDGSVKLRDAKTGLVLNNLMKPSSPATCATFRGDGGLVAAGFDDGAVRLCDPATSQPVGPPRFMRHAVQHLAFSPDGLTVYAIDDEGEFREWPVAEPLGDSNLDDLTLRIEARTGLRMDTSLAISRLDGPAWCERLEQFGRLHPAAVQLDDGPAWHEPMAGAAERNGNGFAARWHLDRLIAARPDDWVLYARRARAWSLSDQFDKAAADYQQAERLSKRGDVLDFQAHCVIDCTRAERWAEALWYLDRLIAARPDDGMLHEDRAAVYGKLGREADRQAELSRVFELGADEGLVIPRAEELGRAGRWAEAAGLLTRLGRTGPLSQQLAQAWGIACLRAGDRAGYREACVAFMARQGPNPTVIWNELSAASLFALGAEGLNDYQVPVGWCERRLSVVPAPRPVLRHLFSNAQGGLLLRAGRIDEAIVRVNEGIAAAKEVEMPSDWAYLALAHAKKGNFAEAGRWLDR